jgi:hypothetical protein
LLLPIVQVLLAIAIIVVVAVQLVDVGVDGTSYSYSCLLGQDYLSTSLCTYTFVVCGVSLVVSSLISIIQCCTCNLCGLGKILDVLVRAAYCRLPASLLLNAAPSYVDNRTWPSTR